MAKFRRLSISNGVAAHCPPLAMVVGATGASSGTYIVHDRSIANDQAIRCKRLVTCIRGFVAVFMCHCNRCQ